MPFNFDIRDGLIEITCHGELTADDLLGVAELMGKAEARLEVAPDRIMDLSNAVLRALKASQLRDVAYHRRMATLKNRVKSAIIAPEPEQFGMARMFLAHNQNPSIDIMVFKDSASAYAWLGRPARADPQ
jgi:hypothetical protein